MSSSWVIHCFGDSLTEGYSYSPDGRLVFFPYATFLKQILQFSDESNPDDETPLFSVSDVKQYGVSGYTTQEIQGVFTEKKEQGKILAERDTNEIFVFLGGTNDLGVGLSEDDAWANMYTMIFDCINNGNKVVVCSIPSTAVANPDSANYKKREAYNEKLKILCHELGTEVCQFVDLYHITGTRETREKKKKMMTSAEAGGGARSEQDEEEEVAVEVESYIVMNPELSADTLHCNADGYRLFAEHIAKALRKFF